MSAVNDLKIPLRTHAPGKTTTVMLFICGVMVFAYTAVRAYLLSVTWDEAYSYTEFVRNGIVFLRQYDRMSANNHALYTWLEIIFVHALGPSEFVLRIPSLLAHVLFLFYSAKLVGNFKNVHLALASFFILNLNPYLLDYFSLARGYGLSLGLMMASLYYLYEFHRQDFKNKFAAFSLLFAALGILANYVLLNYCLALFGLLIVLTAYRVLASPQAGKQKVVVFLRGILFPVLILSLLLWIVLPILLRLRAEGALFYGGSNGFWQDTLGTIVARSLYELQYSDRVLPFAKGLVIVVLRTSIAWLVLQLIRKRISTNTLFLGSVLGLMAVSSTSTMIQHHFLGTLFLKDRTALFLLVLFAMVCVFLTRDMSEESRGFDVVVCLLGLVAILHFGLALNFSYVSELKSNADTKEMLSDLGRIRQVPREKNNISIGVPVELNPTGINFYRDVENLTWLNTVWEGEASNPLHDYFYLSPAELSSINKDSIEILKTYPVTGNVLAKPRNTSRTATIYLNLDLSFENQPGQRFLIDRNTEYSQGFTYIVDDRTTPHKNAIIAFHAQVMAPAVKRGNLMGVVSLQNGQDVYLLQTVSIKDYIKTKDQWVDVDFTCIVPQRTRQGDELKVFIANPNQGELLVKKMNLKWIEYRF